VKPLYKYMTSATGLAVLQNGTLRWSTPSTLNDPYDVQFDLRLELDQSKVRRLALPKLWAAYYDPAPPQSGSDWGELIRQLRGIIPPMSPERFEAEYGEAITEGLIRGERALPEVSQTIREIISNTKLLCLTEAPTNALMWSHYADGHQGIALQFNEVCGLDSPWKMARPVRYVEEMPRLLDEEFLADMFSGRCCYNAGLRT
jgi:hypothetical protein